LDKLQTIQNNLKTNYKEKDLKFAKSICEKVKNSPKATDEEKKLADYQNFTNLRHW